MDTISYKGNGIEAAPYQLADTGEWAMKVYISRDDCGRYRVRDFSASNTFKSRDEAVAHCLRFGKEIIDGKHRGLSVDDV